MRKATDDPLIICTVARLFWAERKIEKARQWFERAVKVNPDLGDVWAWWLKFEMQHGTAVSIFIYDMTIESILTLLSVIGVPRGGRQTMCRC